METKEVSCGLGFVDILQLIFITLKLCGVIEWSWVVVLIPLWVNLGILALVLIVMGIWYLCQVLRN